MLNINEIIIRYLDGSASLDEKIRLLGWLRETEGNRSDFMTTRDLWIACRAVEGSELEVDIALGKFRQRIQQEQERISREQSARWHLPVWARWAGIAATVLLVLAMGYGIGKRTQNTPLIAVQNQLITAQGSKGRFTLPDGSVVWLNEASKLTYPDRFAGDKREVVLEGEAYFEVAHNRKRPFTVDVFNTKVKVYGTSFNVNAYPEDSTISVALIGGSVAFEADGREHLMKPSQLLTYNRSDGSVSLVEVSHPDNYTLWTANVINFRDNTLENVMEVLGRWYDVSFDVEDRSLLSRRFTFRTTQLPLRSLLDEMEYISDLKFELENDRVTVSKK